MSRETVVSTVMDLVRRAGFCRVLHYSAELCRVQQGSGTWCSDLLRQSENRGVVLGAVGHIQVNESRLVHWRTTSRQSEIQQLDAASIKL